MENKQELPAGWKWVKLGEVCQFEYGTGLPERDRINGSVPVFGSNGIVGYHSVSITKGPTIIVGRKGSIGQVNYSIESCWPIDTTYYIDSSKTNCELIWLYWLLKWLRLDLLNKATGVPGLNREDAYSQLVPLPPLSEQRRIAEKLKAMMDEIEEAKASIEKQLEAAKALPSAYLREVFESPEAQKWEKKKLGEVISVIESGGRPKGGVLNIKDGVPSIGAEHLNSSGGFNFTNIRFIPKEFYEVMKKGKIQYGDVLIVKDGATTGRVSFVRNDFPFEHAALNEHVFRLRGNNLLDQEFLFYFLLSPSGQEQIQNEFHGSAQGGINQQFVNTIFIPLPPLSEQKRIAAYLKEKIDQAEKLRETLEKELETLNTLPQPILSKAFRGEI